jgi:CRISPR-associated endonuclease/helicase Cas3
MPRVSEQTKQRNKEQVLMLIRRHRGLREAEIAAMLNIGRRTVNNYLVGDDGLEREGKVYKDRLYWFATENAANWLRRFELAADEAFTLYLAARQFVKQSDKQNPMALSALSRLAEVLKSDLPVGDQIFYAAQDLRKRKKESEYEQIFATVVKAYLMRHPLRLTYRTARDQEVETVFRTYLIEPSAIGFTLYLIGHSDHVNALRSYKIERIVTAVADHDQTYTIPKEFPGLEILRNAWSIMTGETTQRVVLRFRDEKVKRRVLETNWHPSQDCREEADGSLLWWVDVADTTDMKPWIRSWGSDVEVVEPDVLRESIKSHIYAAVQTYKLVTEQPGNVNSRLLRLWGKTTQDVNVFHPALYHMLDVAHVAQQLLSPRATRRWRQALAYALNANADDLHEWLPFLIALHDIGKLSVPFQILNEKQATRLKNEGFCLARANQHDGRSLHHATIGRILLNELPFVQEWPDHFRTACLEVISGHHGTYRPESMIDVERLQAIGEPPEWQSFRKQAVQLLESYLCLQWPDPLPEPANVSAAIAAFNGFCILCDWLGSDETYFTPKPHMALPDYVRHSRRQAYQRVKEAGFFQTAVSHAPTSFAGLFNFPARPLQAAIDHIPNDLLAEPTLTIIEAPTGEGKTEAALALARRIAALRGTDEMFVALPTTATSNAMYDRVTMHLVERLGLESHLVQLVHGQSFLEKDDLSVNPLSNGEGEPPAALDWFAPKKKALLAPFGVGTIDQAELAALNVKHNALRLIGLAGKVVILDEVHAYDTYMTTIIKRMLAWLSALGSSVILLSATLPTQKRQELAAAFAGDTAALISKRSAYPDLLVIGKGAYSPPEAIGVYQPDKQIHVASLPYDDHQAADKANWLLQQVQEGGCACWITNTVDRAQSIFKELRQICPDDVLLTLLHGRFPHEDRARLEYEVLSRYSNGKHASRPPKGIVVGTQVLEQSLDLDFDVMATDLAPIDLILQRAGRLHRHLRHNAERHGHTTARLYLNTAMAEADKFIYSEYILQMTAQAMQERLASNVPLTLPDDYRPLVEQVYATKTPRKGEPLYDVWDKLDAKAAELEEYAEERLANPPDPAYPFCRSLKVQGFKEDEDSSAWVVAQTRWGEESVTVIPLMRRGETAVPILAADTTPIPLDQPADRDTQRRLRQRSIRVSQRQLVADLKKQQAEESHKLFTHSGLLKQCAPLWLEPVDGAHQVFASHNLFKPVVLDPVLGLVIGLQQVSEK